MTDVTMKEEKDNLIFSFFKSGKPFLKIPKSSVISITKRQVDKNDIYKFSIFYSEIINVKNKKKPTSKELKAVKKVRELRLKCSSSRDLLQWINLLKKRIKYKQYDFSVNNSLDSLNDEENPIAVFPIGNARNFYLALCRLEYILAKEQFKEFFNFYFSSLCRNIDDQHSNQSHPETKRGSNSAEKSEKIEIDKPSKENGDEKHSESDPEPEKEDKKNDDDASQSKTQDKEKSDNDSNIKSKEDKKILDDQDIHILFDK